MQDYWPGEIIFGDQDKWACILKKIKEDSSFASIYTHLWENVPRRHGAVKTMEARLQECSILLKNHASKILKWENIISEKGKLYFYMSRAMVSCVCVCVSMSVCNLINNEILRYKISKKT